MLTMCKETIEQQLALLPGVNELAVRADASFPDQAQSWLHLTEQALQKLRRPEASLFSTLRGRLSSAREGFRDPQVPGELTSRKALRATAVVYLSQAEETLRRGLGEIEDLLRPLRGQLAQLVSAASLLGLIPPLGEFGREQWLRLIWTRISQAEQTRGMATYLQTTLGAVDRLYLLDELLGHLNS